MRRARCRLEGRGARLGWRRGLRCGNRLLCTIRILNSLGVRGSLLFLGLGVVRLRRVRVLQRIMCLLRGVVLVLLLGIHRILRTSLGRRMLATGGMVYRWE